VNPLGWLKRTKGLKLGFKCLACGHVFQQRVEKLFCDLNTVERRQKGEPVKYSEFVVPERVICPKCNAVDQFDLAPKTYLELTGHLLRVSMGVQSPDGPVQFIRMGLADGTLIHPFEARDLYAQQVAERPGRVDLRVRYGNVLRSLGYTTEAEAQYSIALELDPGEIEAIINLAALAEARKERGTVYALMRQLIEHAPKSRHPQHAALVKLAQGILDGKWKTDVLKLEAPTLWVTPKLRLKEPGKKQGVAPQRKRKKRR
jgi:hypothetical protein